MRVTFKQNTNINGVTFSKYDEVDLNPIKDLYGITIGYEVIKIQGRHRISYMITEKDKLKYFD